MSLLFYNLFLLLYAAALRIAAPFHAKARKFLKGRKDLFPRLKEALAHERRPVIWMHCASLGEFEQGRPLLKAIRKHYPQYALLLTFFSPSGYEVRKDYEGADFVCYLPLDGKRNAHRFLEIVRPELALFVKYEFWYYYLQALNRRNVPVVLVAAHFQKGQPFFQPYGMLFRKMLTFYQQIFVQDEQSLQLLHHIGIQQVQVAGDTRLDRMKEVLSTPRTFPKVAQFKQGRQLIIAGSSWPEDEAFLKKAFEALPPDEYKLLLVPHDVRPDRLQQILHFFSPDACLWDAPDDVLSTKKVAIVNTVGQLSFLYAYADIAWIGGGFGKGIHNVIEPAVFGVPVFFGPRFNRFKEAVDMCALEGAESVRDAAVFATMVKNPRRLYTMGLQAGDYVATHVGATQKIMDYLAEKCLASTS